MKKYHAMLCTGAFAGALLVALIALLTWTYCSPAVSDYITTLENEQQIGMAAALILIFIIGWIPCTALAIVSGVLQIVDGFFFVGALHRGNHNKAAVVLAFIGAALEALTCFMSFTFLAKPFDGLVLPVMVVLSVAIGLDALFQFVCTVLLLVRSKKEAALAPTDEQA